MSARKSRRSNGRAHGGVMRNFVRRHGATIGVVGGLAGVAGLVVAVVTLVPTFHSTLLAQEANRFAQNADLSIVRVDMTSTVELTERTEFAGSDEVVQTTRVNASAAKIILHNKGEQAALVEELTVHVSKVWQLEGCHGAGGAVTSTIYDFALPGDIDDRTMPLTLSKDIDFEVAGQSNDRMAVTIGEEYQGDAGWPWIIAASAELVLSDGGTLRTDEFVLMNVGGVDRVMEVVDEGVRQGYDRAECVQRNIGLLHEAAQAPGQHSPSVQLLLNRLAESGFTATSTPSSSATAPPDSYLNTWVAQLGSYPEATTSADQLQDAVDKIEDRTGVPVQTARSSKYGSLTQGYWVAFYPGPFADGHEALSFCAQRGITDDNSCVGRYFSSNAADNRLTCGFTEPLNSTRCVRP